MYGTKAQTTKPAVNGYGAPTAEITWVNGKPALSLGAYGGVLISHKLLIGASGNNIFFKQKINGENKNFQLNHYGLYSEYKFQPQKMVHASIGLTGALGWEENELRSQEKTGNKDGDFTYVIQPKLGVNVKVAKFMQVQAFGSYRFTGNTNSIYYTNKNYNGASAGIGLVFGGF